MDKSFPVARRIAIAMVAIGVVQLLCALVVIVDIVNAPLNRLIIGILVGGVADSMRTIAIGAILGVLTKVGARLMNEGAPRAIDAGQ